MSGWRDSVVRLSSGRTRVRERGEGPALIWAHGVLSPIEVEASSSLEPLLGSLEGWRVVRYDARGHGRSDAGATNEAHRWDRLGEDLLALADALAIERFAAGGASLGTATALHAATRAPERLRGLLLVMPPTAWETRPAQARLYLGMAALLAERGSQAFALAAEQGMAAAPIPPAQRAALLANLRGWDPVTLGRVLRGAAASDLPAPESLRRVSCPTLIVSQADDPGHPLSTGEALARALPKATLHVVSLGADPASAADPIRSFLRSLRTTEPQS